MKRNFPRSWKGGSSLLALAGILLLAPRFVQAQNRLEAELRDDKASLVATETLLTLGRGKNLENARKVFEREAARGNAAAQVNLAVFYINGWGGISQNYGTALYWLKEAARQGLPLAYTNLGILYLNGSGVPQNYEEALKDFRFAGEHGETGAMVNLGYMTENGLGIAGNQAEGAEWYRRAAEAGYALGENNLADCYLRGIGVPQSDSLAATWFQKAAEQGQAAARIKLGFLFMTGRGVPKDAAAAYQWILAASLAGDHRGDEYLPELRAELRPEQMEWAAQHAKALQATSRETLLETAYVP